MTYAECAAEIGELKKVFDIVRLVDAAMTTQYSISPTGEIRQEPYECYAVWNRTRRCENCISAKALCEKCTMTKFEFIDSDVYFVISKYIEVEGVPYMMEMVIKVTDQTLFGAYGQNSFVDTINTYNKKLYLDALTGAYNRRYYNEQLCELPKINALAMVDADHFKLVNDNYGHPAGDFVLQEMVRLTQALLCPSDAIVRFGGDEFLLVFQEITEQSLREKLEAIRKAVSEIRSQEYPSLRASASIGAVYCRENSADLLHEADKALYQAKKERNTVKISTHCPELRTDE